MDRYTLDHGVVADDGVPMLTLVRARWGDDAPLAAALDDLSQRIVDALNDRDEGPPTARERAALLLTDADIAGILAAAD